MRLSDRIRVQQAIDRFPRVFGLRGFPGQFTIDAASSDFNYEDPSEVLLSLQSFDDGRSKGYFADASVEELEAQLVVLDGSGT